MQNDPETALSLFLVVASVFSVELFNTSLGSRETLTACVERMAVAAGIYAKGVTFDGGAAFECVTAGRAYNSYGMVIRMDSLFHRHILLPP